VTAEHYEIREASTLEDFEKAVAFQQIIWGENIASLTHMIAAGSHGGAVLLAVSHGEVIGFSYGFSGYKNGEAYLVSHMLAIHPDARDKGIGRKLKLEQRKWALEHGYDKMVWTFDPLETRNANLNLCKLGGYVKTYIENYYGFMNDKLNTGMPTDRFLLEWDLNSPKALAAIEGRLDSSKWNGFPSLFGVSYTNELPVPDEVIKETDSDQCLLPVPSAFQSIKLQNLELALAWRYQIRSLLTAKLKMGFRVEGIIRTASDSVNSYVLIR
jgi:predicted GNAT superfamily acetyltransferase